MQEVIPRSASPETSIDNSKHIGWTEALGDHASNPPTPRTSGDSIYALGKHWKVSSCEMRIKAQFEQWVRLNAKQAITEALQAGDAEEADAMRKAYMSDIGAGHYTWDGRNVRSARGDMPGVRYLVYLLLNRCDSNVTYEMAVAIVAENPVETGMAIGWSLGNFSPLKNEGTPTKS